MEIDQARKIHDAVVDGYSVEAANSVLEAIGSERRVKNVGSATAVLQDLVQHLLDNEMYLEAASLLWGKDRFASEPESVRRVFKAMRDGSTILLMGASSMGKTFNAGIWLLLDYLRDPLYTTVKLAAINEDHLRKNLFSHVADRLRGCAIQPRHEIQIRDSDLWIGIKSAGYAYGISGIAFKQSQETSGQFKGYKINPVRPKPHPKFGVMSRLRVLGDEGQNWPGGPFKDFNSLIASKSGKESIKIAVAFNPESTSQLVVQMAEPEDGWTIEGMDKLYDWESKSGWLVCRLDAAKCENVVHKKEIYQGLQTYDGYTSYLKAGGDNSPNYTTFARGWPPVRGTYNNVIPPQWPTEMRGEAVFIENPIVLATVDIAFQGGDTAQMAIFRWGLASGWRNQKNEYVKFRDRLNITREKPHHVLQVDQLLPMERHEDTIMMAEEIMGRCKQMLITPDHVAVDKTGIGFGVHSHLVKVWGPVYGIGWNEGSTETKILSEDTAPASEQCEGIMSEMWWAFRRWLDPVCSSIIINPIIPTQPIHNQLTSRRFSTVKAGKIKVESKEQYKARNAGRSPDEADALVMGPQLVRKISDTLPGLVEHEARGYSTGGEKIKYESATKPIQIETSDTLEIPEDESMQGEEDAGLE